MSATAAGEGSGAPLTDDDQAPISSRPTFAARAARTPAFVAGAGLTGALLLLAVLAPVIGRYSPVQQNLLATLQGPSAAHWLGTDEFGRDIWSRLLYGGRTDLQVGVLAVVLPFTFGSLLGTVCGYLGGWLDGIVMRVVDVVLAFPFYVLIIALVFFVGEGTHGIYIAFALTDWVVYAGRIVETGPVGAVLDAPRHPYTAALLASAIDVDNADRAPRAIPGEVPDPFGLPPGCPFQPRCPIAQPDCAAGPVPLRDVGAGRSAACLHYDALAAGPDGAAPAGPGHG